MLMPAFAAPSLSTALSKESFAKLPALSCKRLSGSINAGYDTNYVGRGLVVSHSVTEGDSSEFVALKLNYDVGKKDYWSIDSAIGYKMVSSGHTLYGPKPYDTLAMLGHPIPYKNIENEFAVVTGARFKAKYGQIAFGHNFVHGGLLGAMAKHFRGEGASAVNELYFTTILNLPQAPWLETGLTTRYSFSGIQGWWFEPYITFKAPVIGTKENPTLVTTLTLGMSATLGYFDEEYVACANGAQAYWIKLATPWYVTKDIILTPSLSFNWLGNGGMKANRHGSFKPLNPSYVPFQNFAVVAGVSCTYVF